MHVVATAGHVDHGKSALAEALTGTDPDRLEEEHRRGLSIQLGYCWTTLEPVGEVAFVDVPGHERFITTMLSGIGPVPAVLFVVAADDPWMPQAAEHLAALNALGVSHGVVAVTRSDLADPRPAAARAAAHLAGTSLGQAPVIAVSARTGDGLDDLRGALVAMVGSLPPPDAATDVRLWVDRRFTVRGAGTVVTGTLPAGRIRAGDVLQSPSGPVRVREVQSLERRVDGATGVARVALNVTGDDLGRLVRGSVLVTPSAWHFTDVVDVRLASGAHGHADGSAMPPQAPLLHVGATSVSTHCRPLDGALVRLRLERPLPLRVGDRALLRDPGSRAVWGVAVLDPAPPALRRRGAAGDRAAALDSADGMPDLTAEVERRGLVHASLLARIGVPVPVGGWPGTTAAGWMLSDARAADARTRIEQIVGDHDRRSPLDPGVPIGTLAERLGLPTPELVSAVVPASLTVAGGRVFATGARTARLPTEVERAVRAVHGDLASEPFLAPTADRLRELGLDARTVAAAAKAGRLLKVSDGIVLLPGADRLAAQWLAELPQPFTTSQARVRLGTSRRVVLPLLNHLDKQGSTRRLPDDRRVVTVRVAS